MAIVGFGFAACGGGGDDETGGTGGNGGSGTGGAGGSGSGGGGGSIFPDKYLGRYGSSSGYELKINSNGCELIKDNSEHQFNFKEYKANHDTYSNRLSFNSGNNWLDVFFDKTNDHINSVIFNIGSGQVSIERNVDPFTHHTHDNWGWAAYTAGSGLRECQTDGCTVKARVGDTGAGGGIIIYANATVITAYNANYLEAAPTNQATNIKWSNTDEDVTGAMETAIGTGKANTAAIIAAHPSDTVSNNAANAAVAYLGGEKNDWFLPSKDELNEMYKARTHLGISSGWFWSSSQGTYLNAAWLQDFSFGSQQSYFKDFTMFDIVNVRAVRAF